MVPKMGWYAMLPAWISGSEKSEGYARREADGLTMASRYAFFSSSEMTMSSWSPEAGAGLSVRKTMVGCGLFFILYRFRKITQRKRYKIGQKTGYRSIGTEALKVVATSLEFPYGVTVTSGTSEAVPIILADPSLMMTAT